MKPIFRKSEQIALDEKKKKEIRNNLVRFMKQHPLESPLHWWQFPEALLFLQRRRYQLALLSILIFLLGGEYLILASVSLPGDLLYPVKLGFNEQIKGMVYFSDEEKSKLYIELAEKRLLEAEQIENRDEISDKDSALLKENFVRNSEKAIEAIKSVENIQEKERIVNEFEKSLINHQRALTPKLEADSTLKTDSEPKVESESRVDEKKNKVRSLSVSVEEAIKKISEIRSSLKIGKEKAGEEKMGEKASGEEKAGAKEEEGSNSKKEKMRQPNNKKSIDDINKN